MKICEATLQAVLMYWAMVEKNHDFVVPNSNTIFWWEADLLTFTKSRFVHEFEVKLNIYDYRADAKKLGKHQSLKQGVGTIPNYFWYATTDFEIEPPEYAGWIKIINDKEHGWKVVVVKDAPRLHNKKTNDRQREAVARILSHHLRRQYWNAYTHIDG